VAFMPLGAFDDAEGGVVALVSPAMFDALG
jgi:hypothetical protein